MAALQRVATHSERAGQWGGRRPSRHPDPVSVRRPEGTAGAPPQVERVLAWRTLTRLFAASFHLFVSHRSPAWLAALRRAEPRRGGGVLLLSIPKEIFQPLSISDKVSRRVPFSGF